MGDRNTKFGGRGGGRGEGSSGKQRVFDRRSGTGRGREIKKDGDGARNWGSDQTEARNAATANNHHRPNEEEEENEEYAAEDADENGNVAESEVKPVEGPAPVVDNTISYEDYLKAKASEGFSSELLAPVKERQVDDEFANMKPSATEEQDFLVMGGGKAKKKKDSKSADEKSAAGTTTDLLAGLRVASGASSNTNGGQGRGGRDGRGDGRSGRGGRDGRGDGRGGRDGGRGGGRGREGRGRGGRGRDEGGRDFGGRGRGRSRAPMTTFVNVNDETAFPSL